MKEAEYAATEILSAESELTNVVDWFQAENEALCAKLATVTAERDVAMEFIEYLDKNYSGYINEYDKFKEWRGERSK